MTDIRKILYGLLLGMLLASCSTADEIPTDQDVDQQVVRQVELLTSINNKTIKPHQSPSSVNRRAATFQGMELLVAIPFHTNGDSVASTDIPLINLVGANEETNRVVEHNTYYVGSCHMMKGTDRLLVYGKSYPSSAYPSINGVLSPLPTNRIPAKDIHFSLSSIRGTTEAHPEAIKLAEYMTTIANTPGWSTTTDNQLQSYYMDFIHIDNKDGATISGSAAHIKAFVTALRALLAEKSDPLSIAIKENIDNDDDIADITYPRSIGLPDGAAAIRWMGNSFTVRTTTTTLDNINGINRYTYPAELVFFTNSPIRTSSTSVPYSVYRNASTTQAWSDFLDTYYNSSRSVNSDTKAVAAENPLQYGVANLQMTLTGMSATLLDAKDEEVENTSMATLPLKGIIIGGQHTIGFNMKPQGEQTDVDSRFIYETNIISGNSTNTLVLQSYDGEKVPVMLEFENKTGHPFTGKDGIVYPNTRFYLIAMLTPAEGSASDYANRVFTQDYTTTLTARITSLANAYTCMPDLLAPRLEIGVQVVTKWIQSTTVNIEL